jgi:lysophospholipase
VHLGNWKPETGFIEAADGTKLYYCYQSTDKPRALLVFVHGFAEHIGRYQHVMEWFIDQNYDVAGFDCRGHGQSEGRRCYVERFDQYLDDLDGVLSQLLEKAGVERKLYLIGHSHGGLIVSNYVLDQSEGVDGVILSGPCFKFKVEIPAWKNALGKLSSKLWPTLSIPSGIPPEHLTHEQSFVDAYKTDPLVSSKATSRWYTEALGAQKRVLSQADRIQIPVIVLQGGEDKLVDPDTSKNFLGAVGAADKELRWYDDLYHEIFNETTREEVFTDLAEWLDQHV